MGNLESDFCMDYYDFFYFVAAPQDYTSSSFEVTFFPDSSISRSLCVNISISSDENLEDTEDFLIFINSLDSSVFIEQPFVFVEIVDRNG